MVINNPVKCISALECLTVNADSHSGSLEPRLEAPFVLGYIGNMQLYENVSVLNLHYIHVKNKP